MTYGTKFSTIYFGDDNEKLSSLFHLLEVITFRARLINSRANIQERLNISLLEFDGNLGCLLERVKHKLNESWYWGDSNTANYLNGAMYGNNVLNYLLWRYENSIQHKGYTLDSITINDEQIEHISPQHPTNGEPIKTGYEVDANNEYSDDFISRHLNSIGNLMLISGSHNRSVGNKPFKEKLLTYKENPIVNQQAEIEMFAKNENSEPVWKSESIIERHKKIVEFAVKNWSFENIG